MSSAHAPVPGHDGTDLSEEFGAWADESPILLADIDQILEESAHVERARASDPIRAWRDDLKVALDSLAYARAVLAADVGILRHCLAAPHQQAVVDDLPSAMTTRTWGDGWSAPAEDEPDPARVDGEIFVRSDWLMAAHQEMAHADLSSREEVTRVLGELEAQLNDLAQRQEAVEVRLREIRAAIVRQYKDGRVPARDWLG
ncbi:MAG TPA: hypothetical protein VN886_10775 [Acidimicrobiales bacterium]|jgi:hypothetical protein|nr:hypothetical protein [Acidimicrobiales bacterium]